MAYGTFYDRIKDTSTTTGTSDFTVSGSPPTGYLTLGSVYAVNDVVPYVIVHQSANEWECGFGTYSASNTLQRTDVRSSSNAGAAVNFSSGTKDVFVDAHAAFVNDLDTHGAVLARATFQAMP